MTNQAAQLQELIRKGFDIKDAAESLGLDIDAASMQLSAMVKQRVSLEQMVADWKPTGVRILMDLAEDYNVEPRDRIAAAKILLTGEGVAPDVNADDMSRRLTNMRRAMGNIVDKRQTIMDVEDLSNKCFELAAA